MRRSLRLLLEGESELGVVAEADDLPGVMRQMVAHHPDVLVLDLSLPEGSSLLTIRRLSEGAPATRIVAISMHAEPSFARAAMDAGASGFVLKETADVELPQAIREAAAAT
jgi:two-component system response regulator NreC